jgi:hypothetical protein
MRSEKNDDGLNGSNTALSVNPRLIPLLWISLPCIALSIYIGLCQPKLENKIEDTLSHILRPELYTRETLQRDYEEVFATPFRNVKVSEYMNSKAGHGALFVMTLKSTCPLQLKDPEAYETVAINSPKAASVSGVSPDWFLKNHAPWIAVCLYKQKPYPVKVWYNKIEYELKSGSSGNCVGDFLGSATKTDTILSN